MTDLERRLKAKLPGEDTGIVVKRSLCDICAPGTHCGLSVYVKDGEVIKVEGLDGYPNNNGHLCVRGASTRQYLYRKGRLQYPMRRIGPRGSGQYERITWDEAMREIAQKLNAIKEEHGPESVMWYTGYSKWYRPWLQRLAYSFGSPNYGAESSTCAYATMMAWQDLLGRRYAGDNKNAGVYLGWGCNAWPNKYTMTKMLRDFKERGGRIITIDTRDTPTGRRLSDIHLQVHPGTDGALALGMANMLIEKGWVNQPYIDKYVHGYNAYREMVKEYTLEKTAQITGVPEEKIAAAVQLFAENLPAVAYTPSASIPHHLNGFNSMRAIMSLLAITGCIDVKGGSLPRFSSGDVHGDCGFDTHEDDFIYATMRKDMKEGVGMKRFPVWASHFKEVQAMDMPRAILEGDPYPIKALMAFGMNARMFPRADKLPEVYEKLDLIVAVDLVKTDVCEYADYILPACTSLERSELKGYGGGLLTCTKPAIEPLFESKNDAEIICDFARYLDLDDELLKAGYDATMRYIISDLSVTLEELREAPLPVKVKELRSYQPGTFLKNGFETPTGKIELYSETIVACHRKDLNPLPVYYDAFDDADREQYPYTLITGARIPNGLHSRMHEVPWARTIRPEPTADINRKDAEKLGIKAHDMIELYTQYGSIRVRAAITDATLPGDVYMYHGYKEADVNTLFSRDHLDPYSGFVGYGQSRCCMRKAED